MSIPFETYEARRPSPQTAVDAIRGWVGAFPPEYRVVAGDKLLYQDGRIAWLLERYGSVLDAQVLEIGPLEGAHTSILHRHGAHITAVEANRNAFLKCLVAKEIIGMARANFLLGDCIQFLEENTNRYDLVVACGVLYHMREPLRLLSAIAGRTDNLYIWTHFVDVSTLAANDPARSGWASTEETTTFAGKTATLYRRSYVGANENAEFSGGIFDEHRWMSRDTIINALEALAFKSIEIAHETDAIPGGPSFSILARR
jgi:Methyltransferase domain